MSAVLSHSQAINNITLLQASLNELILGKEEKIDLAICCLISAGHLLIEGLPGEG